jgi:putative membrane protein
MAAMPSRRAVARLLTLLLPALLSVAVPPIVAAHGPAPAEPPSIANLALGWTWPTLPTLGILAAALLWWRAVRRVARAHPGNPVPRWRSATFAGGLLALAIALLSGIERYDTTLFSIHMVQHILLTLVAAPLIALSAPVTLLLRVAAPDVRRRWILPVLHSRVLRVLSFPVIAWVLFAVVMWVAHFSPLFEAALEDPLIHEVEHALFLGAALLFWWPAVAQDPAPWRMPHPVRAMYVFLQMPQNTFLAVVLLGASAPLYPHYATLDLEWGTTPLADQQLAAGIMWLVGDLLFLAAVLGIVAAWLRAEDRAAARHDRRADAELVGIREREARLAERLARERDAAAPAARVATPGAVGSAAAPGEWDAGAGAGATDATPRKAGTSSGTGAAR